MPQPLNDAVEWLDVVLVAFDERLVDDLHYNVAGLAGICVCLVGHGLVACRWVILLQQYQQHDNRRSRLDRVLQIRHQRKQRGIIVHRSRRTPVYTA